MREPDLAYKLKTILEKDDESDDLLDKLNEISDKLKSKVLDRKIKRAKVKFYSNLKRVTPKD